MSFFKRLFGEKQPEPQGLIHLDFEQTFPHIFWTSGWMQDSEYPEGCRYKVLSMRREPNGDIEVVLVQEARDGTKMVLQRLSVAFDDFAASAADFIQMLEERLGVTFDRVDMTSVRTPEEFEAKSRQIGWEVS